MAKKSVLILCTGNSSRSQMAEGFLRHIAGDRFEVFSAGTKPRQVRPEAVAVMRELGIDISLQRSKHVDEYAGQTFDYVLTVCDNARETCPLFSNEAQRIHWSFADPAIVQGDDETRCEAFRRIRDQIASRLQIFVSTER